MNCDSSDKVSKGARIESATAAVGEAVLHDFARRFGRPAEILVRAPGRLCLLGAHVDTAEGWVLPGAIDRSIWLAAARASGSEGTLLARDLGLEHRLALDHLVSPLAERPTARLEWIDYPRGVAWALVSAGHQLQALDVVFGGDVPRGAGVSSSAAVEVAFLLAWNALAGLGIELSELTRLAARVEQNYVGVRSGVMDPFASLFGRADHLLLLDCRDLSHRAVALPASVEVVVVDSGIRRRLAASGFNQRRQECSQALDRVRRQRPSVRTLRDIAAADLDSVAAALPEPLDRRVRHVVEECIRVQAGAAALQRGDLPTFGRMIRRSHESSRDQFESSLPELDAMAAAAWDTPGCLGARFMGGGFGGCVAALVETGADEAVSRAMIAARAAGSSPDSAEAPFVCRFGPGATIEWEARC